MARRMYDLDNGTEKIKVKEIVADKITAGGGVFKIDGGVVSFESQIKLGAYGTSSRPTGRQGAIIYDISLKKCILWNGTAWVNLDGTALS